MSIVLAEKQFAIITIVLNTAVFVYSPFLLNNELVGY